MMMIFLVLVIVFGALGYLLRDKLMDTIYQLWTEICRFFGYRKEHKDHLDPDNMWTAMKRKPIPWCVLAIIVFFIIVSFIIVLFSILSGNQSNATKPMEPMEPIQWNQSNGTNPMEPTQQIFATKLGLWNDHFLVDEVHKLMYCYIPKNSCTKFKMLFHTLATNGTRYRGDGGMQGANLGRFKKETADIVENVFSDWSTFVVIRDPAERLLSGFLDKCLGTYKWCEGPTNLNENEFAIFAERVIDKVQHNPMYIKHSNRNDHFIPQHMMCGLDVIYPKYVDDVIVYNKQTVAANTVKFLEKYHLDSFNDGYGKFGNETLFDAETTHMTRENVDDCFFYRKYYDMDLYNKVRKAFSRDYDLFDLGEPQWTTCLQ